MTLYLDMDGVIADFFNGFARKFGKDHWKMIQDKEKAIAKLRGTDFFNTLDVFPTSQKLIDFARSTGDWGICSSPLTGDRDNSAYWKRVWLTDKGWLPSIDKLIFTGMKEKYATDKLDGTPNILVDDKPSNIDRWISKGGIGILYQANECSFDYVTGEIQNALRKI
jgi:5'(3')-deoxyribonucleotidase